MTKPFGVRELQARIQTALRRLPTEGERLEAGPLSILPKSRETFLDGRRVELTAREYELLLYLARRAGSTVTRGELLREVWGYATEEDPSRTVDAHVKTLRLKLGDTRRRAATHPYSARRGLPPHRGGKRHEAPPAPPLLDGHRHHHGDGDRGRGDDGQIED